MAALIDEYVGTAVPVGSQTLVERHGFNVSPATIRSELSALEEGGYVVSPHVSAGRIPTDYGYRSFVDVLLGLPADEAGRPLAIPGRKEGRVLAIAGRPEDRLYEVPGSLPPFHLQAQATEFDDLIGQVSIALSHFTNCLAIVIAPSVARASLRRISLVALGPRECLIVLVTREGTVLNRHVAVDMPQALENLATREVRLNALLVDDPSVDASFYANRGFDDVAAALGDDPLSYRLITEIAACLADADSDADRAHHQGMDALLSQPEFRDAAAAIPLARMVEGGMGLASLLDGVADAEGTVVRIGHENGVAAPLDVSVVAEGYRMGAANGLVAVVGPTRMDYGRAIAAVRVAAGTMEETLS